MDHVTVRIEYERARDWQQLAANQETPHLVEGKRFRGRDSFPATLRGTSSGFYPPLTSFARACARPSALPSDAPYALLLKNIMFRGPSVTAQRKPRSLPPNLVPRDEILR